MKLLDLTLPTPAENLACDEALLDWCEDGARHVPGRSSHELSTAPEIQTGTSHCKRVAGGNHPRFDEGILRFWESPEYFVVVGYANKVATEVNVAACKARGVPILRRCSGGGTVLQGPGCLNYALVLRITDDGPLRSVSTVNRFIMERNRAAIEAEVRGPKPEARILVCGHTDLTVYQPSTINHQLKFSGNSQRRRKHFLLFHGTFLLNFDLALVSEILTMPSKQPDYRASRSHADFVTNLNVPTPDVKAALCKTWGAAKTLEKFPSTLAGELATRKYSTDAWNLKL